MAEETKEVATKDAGGKLTFQQRGIDLPQNVTLTTADIKKYIAPKASDADLYMFVNIARSQGLNPFAREIYFIPYGDKSSIVVGYEVYLKRAYAAGLVNGWKLEILDKGTEEHRCKITIWRKGCDFPFEWEVKAGAFRKSTPVWQTMPDHMLKKVAISQGFRLVFPDAIGGMPYTAQETEAYQGTELEIETQATVTDTPPANAENVFDGLKEAKPVVDAQPDGGKAKGVPGEAGNVPAKDNGAPDALHAEMEQAGLLLDERGDTNGDPAPLAIPSNELDDIELDLIRRIESEATPGAVEYAIKAIGYDRRFDGAKIFGKAVLTNKTKLERLLMYYQEVIKKRAQA